MIVLLRMVDTRIIDMYHTIPSPKLFLRLRHLDLLVWTHSPPPPLEGYQEQEW